MPDSKISELQRLTDLAGRDLLLVIDTPLSNTSSSTNKNITVDGFFGSIPSNTSIYANAYINGNTSVNTLQIRNNATPATANTAAADRSFWSDGQYLYFKPVASPIVSIQLSTVNNHTVAGLPTGSLGQQSYVIDGNAGLNWGDIVTGGGTTKYEVWFNGTSWTVTGK